MQPPRKRPIGITLLAIPFLWIGGAGSLTFPFVIPAVGRSFWDILTPYLFHSRPLALAATTLILILWMAGYLLYGVLGYGLWKLRPWAFKATVIVNYIAMAGGVVAAISFLRLSPLLVFPVLIALTAPNAGILWYLKRPNVRAAFGQPIPPPAIMPSNPRKPWVLPSVFISVGTILVALFIGSFLYALQSFFRGSDVYAMSINDARNSPCVLAKLGAPLVAKGFISGSLNTSTTDGDANLDIPIHGPKGTGSLQVTAKELNNHWTLTTLTLYDDEGQIHLLPTPSCP